MANLRFCPHCGQKIQMQGKFCINCGESLIVGKEQASKIVVDDIPENVKKFARNCQDAAKGKTGGGGQKPEFINYETKKESTDEYQEALGKAAFYLGGRLKGMIPEK